MPTDTFKPADLAEFEKSFNPAAAPIKAVEESRPAGDSASAEDANNGADDVTSEQTSGSSTETAVDDDVNVESSTTADTTDAGASGEPDNADLTSETADTQPTKPRNRAQERIESLVASNKALKASLDYMQQEVLAKLPQSQQQQPTTGNVTPSAATEEAPPTLESCGFDTDRWTQEMHSWTRKQIDSGVQRAVQTVKQDQTEEARRAAFNSRLATFEKATPDLKIVLGNPALPRLGKDAAELVVDSDFGPQILYYLGKNPEKAANIARQSPAKQAAAIGRIEAEVAAANRPSPKTKTNTSISRAPAPPNPTAGRGNTPTVDPNKMSAKEWIEWDRKQTIEKRKAKGPR